MEEGDKRRVIENYIRAYNHFDINGMASLMHTQCIFEDISDGQVTLSTKGVTEFRELAEQSKELFSSRSQTAVEFKYDEDIVTVTIIYTAVLKTDLPSGLRAGETIKLNGKSVFEFRDGVIYKLTDYS